MKNPVKSRVKSKMTAAKKRIKSKVKVASVIAVMAMIFGCSTSEPASRVTKAEYGDIVIKVADSSNTTLKITLGDGAMSSSDSSGSTETTTSTPTNTTDIRPDVDVNTTGSRSAGVLETFISAGLSAITGKSSSTSGTSSSSTSSSTSNTSTDCTNCESGACTDCSYNQSN